MSTQGREHTASDSYEQDPVQYAVVAVPHMQDYTPNTDITKLTPTHETLELIRISNAMEENAALNALSMYTDVEREIANVSTLSPAAIKAEYLRRKFSMHAPIEVPIAGYVPAHNRGSAALQLAKQFEWVTVVKRGEMYLGLNDAEFEEWRSDDMVVVGQAIRHAGSPSEELRASYSLLGLFGVDESGQLQR